MVTRVNKLQYPQNGFSLTLTYLSMNLLMEIQNKLTWEHSFTTIFNKKIQQSFSHIQFSIFCCSVTSVFSGLSISHLNINKAWGEILPVDFKRKYILYSVLLFGATLKVHVVAFEIFLIFLGCGVPISNVNSPNNPLYYIF